MPADYIIVNTSLLVGMFMGGRGPKRGQRSIEMEAAIRGGSSIAEVAELFDVDPQCVRSMIRDHAPDIDVKGLRRERDDYKIKDILHQRGAALSLAELSRFSGLTRHRIKASLERLGVSLAAKPRSQSERSLAIRKAVLATGEPSSVARQFGVSRQAVRGLMRRHHPDVDLSRVRDGCDDAKVKAALGQHGKEITLPKLCSETNLSRKKVINSLERLNLSLHSQAESLVGQVFGLWLVLEPIYYYREKDGTMITRRTATSGNSPQLKCRCGGCQEVGYPLKRYLLEGQSSSCVGCSAQLRNGPTKAKGIKGQTTGRVFKSLKRATRDLEINRKELLNKVQSGDPVDGEVWQFIN